MDKNVLHIDIEIDKLTNSIENTISGDSFKTDVILLESKDLKNVTKSKGWLFNWRDEFKTPDRDVYKLTIKENQNIIQGLISITEREDHVFLNLIESAPFNLGKNKLYNGVPGNLIAFACKISFHRGFDGYVSFLAKSKLIEHYEQTLGAQRAGGLLMVINTHAALKLIDKYFKD